MVRLGREKFAGAVDLGERVIDGSAPTNPPWS
jgi:hypothetical protein